MDTGSYVLKNH